MGRSVNVIAPPIRGSGPNDWHVEKGLMQPGLDPATEQRVLNRRLARAGQAPVAAVPPEPPSKAELREKAKALTLAEQELAAARAQLEAEREAFEQAKAEQEARATARGGK